MIVWCDKDRSDDRDSIGVGLLDATSPGRSPPPLGVRRGRFAPLASGQDVDLDVPPAFGRVDLASLLNVLASAARAEDPRPACDDVVAKLLYRGFTVDISALDEVKDAAQTLVSLKRQIDNVVAARVKPEIAAFFSTVQIKLGDVKDDGLGVYNGSAVVLTIDPIHPDRGALIHELLHAYHDRKMGKDEMRRVSAYFEEAPQAYNLPKTEYAMSSDSEFFAVTASIYLHGKSSRKPHDRRTIRAAQPDYYKFLGELFDPETADARKAGGR